MYFCITDPGRKKILNPLCRQTSPEQRTYFNIIQCCSFPCNIEFLGHKAFRVFPPPSLLNHFTQSNREFLETIAFGGFLASAFVSRAFFSCDPLWPPSSSVGMTNNAVEGGTMRGPQRALSPQHRCILAQGSPVVSGGGGGGGWWVGVQSRGRGIKVIRHLILQSTSGFLLTSSLPWGLVLAVVSRAEAEFTHPTPSSFFICQTVSQRWSLHASTADWLTKFTQHPVQASHGRVCFPLVMLWLSLTLWVNGTPEARAGRAEPGLNYKAVLSQSSTSTAFTTLSIIRLGNKWSLINAGVFAPDAAIIK